MRNRIVRISTLAVLAAAVLIGAVTAIPRRVFAATLNASVIGMFPKDIGEFAYADLKASRKYSWFPQLRDQLLPSRFVQFEQFLKSAGVDPNSQVDELAWGGISNGKGEEIVGVALGSFDPSSSEAKFKAQKMPMVDVQGYHLYAFGTGAGANDILFLFIDANTAAFGHRSALEKLINVRMGAAESLANNSTLYPLIQEANGNGILWAVLDRNYTHLAMQQLLPQASQFPQAQQIVDRMHAMTIYVSADSGVDAHFQAVCDSVNDANTLAAALQAGVMYRRYQVAQTDPTMAKTLDHITVVPAGDRLKIDAPVTQDELMSLIQTKAFASPI
ncbi:MAG: hypothetical protein WA823_05395 [Candidatus Acidiferrales bacterium]